MPSTSATNLTVPYTPPQPTCPLVPPPPQNAIPFLTQHYEVISTSSIFLFGIVLPIIIIAYITFFTDTFDCCFKRPEQKRASSPEPLSNKITTTNSPTTALTTKAARKILS